MERISPLLELLLIKGKEKAKKMKKTYSEEIIIMEAIRITEPKESTYTVSSQMGIPQATVWRHLNNQLPRLNHSLYLMVRRILERNDKGGRRY